MWTDMKNTLYVILGASGSLLPLRQQTKKIISNLQKFAAPEMRAIILVLSS
jgi:hypothetical protein